jgi:imidazole glycerol phosphate synthase subunit HisF
VERSREPKFTNAEAISPCGLSPAVRRRTVRFGHQAVTAGIDARRSFSRSSRSVSVAAVM